MIPIDMARDANGPGYRSCPTEPEGTGGWIVLYDHDCGFCRWSLARVLALDARRRLRPVPIASEEGSALLADMPQAERQASWHLIYPDGRRASAGAAAPDLFRLLKGGRTPAALLEVSPALTERTYRFVANHRSWFGKLIPQSARARADRVIAARVQAARCEGSTQRQAAASAGS